MAVVSQVMEPEFVVATGYKTETELFGWSFVLDSMASDEVIAEVDGETGYGRVKDSLHWCAVKGATWHTPFGPDSSVENMADMPVVQVSFKDAVEYCSWAGPDYRLLTEVEWEFAARGGRVNETYPWGNRLKAGHVRMNVWEGKFPEENLLVDGFHGPAPVLSFPAQNAYGLYNMLGNVWEWVEAEQSKKDDGQRVLRGGSFVDSLDGSFNHVVMVSTRQTNAADSAGRVCVGQLNNSTTLLYDRIALLMIYLLDNSYRLYRSFLSPSNLPTT